MKRVKNCDKCQKQFFQQWMAPCQNWSQINDVSYWTDGKGWNGYEFLCRSCLNNWFEQEREAFSQLVTNPSRLRTFRAYRGSGTFLKNDDA
jgi:hypothetical protein